MSDARPSPSAVKLRKTPARPRPASGEPSAANDELDELRQLFSQRSARELATPTKQPSASTPQLEPVSEGRASAPAPTAQAAAAKEEILPTSEAPASTTIQLQLQDAVIHEPDQPLPPQALADSLLRALLDNPDRAARPVHTHAERLSSGRRGLGLPTIRALRTFYAAHGGLDRLMADVCKEAGYSASVCALTRATGLSLAETIVLRAAERSIDATTLIGLASTFFSYSWTGTRLADMLWAIETKLIELEANDHQPRYVWVRCVQRSDPLGCLLSR